MPFGGGGGGVALPVVIANGGTGATTAAAALAALGGVGAGAHAVKFSDGSGNISFTATSLTKLFGTSLDISLTVPTGSIALALATFSTVGPNANSLQAGISVDGTVKSGVTIAGSSSQNFAGPLMALLVGDGSSHAFSVMGAVSAGTATLQNSTFQIPLIAMHVVLVVPAS